MAYIEFRDVVKRFGDNTVLDHINFGIRQGDLVTLLGPSGCGKSTLLRCLSGLESVSEGQIVLDGRDVTNVPASKRNIGMVFQQYSLFPNMTVEQNVAFGLKMKKVDPVTIEKKVAEAIAMVELTGKEKAYPASLSGGQQQRAALARSIVTEPAVLLLDEPLSAIDAKLRKALQSRIREIHQELGLTTIFVTHDQDEAMVMSDVIQLFHSGRIEQAGSPVEVYTHPVSEFAASFIGSYNQLTGELNNTDWMGAMFKDNAPLTPSPETPLIHFGAAALNDLDGTGFLYIYAQTDIENDIDPVTEVYVARTTEAGLFSSWEYWNGSSWSPDQNSVAALSGLSSVPVSSQFNVFKLEDKYVLIAQNKTWNSGEIYTFTSDNPWGPWGHKTLIYKIPGLASPNWYSYNAMAHPQFEKDGMILISYNVNTSEFAEQKTNVESYRPRFFWVEKDMILNR